MNICTAFFFLSFFHPLLTCIIENKIKLFPSFFFIEFWIIDMEFSYVSKCIIHSVYYGISMNNWVEGEIERMKDLIALIFSIL
jgi:hypothetical protein